MFIRIFPLLIQRLLRRENTIFLLLSLLAFSSSPVFAQDGSLRLVSSPLPISLIVEPGKTISTQLKVKNAGTEEERLKIDILKFNAYEESGKPALMDLEPTDTLDDWVSFSEPTFSLAPEEWKTITVTFTVPETAAFGYYYAFVFNRADESLSPKPQQTAVIGGTATLVLLEARVPDAKREVTVSEFSTDKKVYEFLPTRFTVALKNTGNVHVAPRGNIFLSDWKGKEVALLEVNEAKGNILPSSTRIFDSEWRDGFPVYEVLIDNNAVVFDEAGNPEQDLVWDFEQASKLRFGKYTAKLLLIYDDGTKDIPIEGLVSFWVIPWRIIGGGVFVFLFFFIGIRSTLVKVWRKFFPLSPGSL